MNKKKERRCRCIACGDEKARTEKILFMMKQMEFSICERCYPYLGKAFADKNLGESLMRFMGVTHFDHTAKRKWVFACSTSSDATPLNLSEKLEDFDLFCQFLGKRIQMAQSEAEK